MTNIVISSLHIYPIKSCGGIDVTQATLTPRGFEYDRQWMIVQDDDEERGMFLTQRELPEMALIQPIVEGDTLLVRAPGMSALRVPLAQPPDAPTMPVVVWRDTCVAVDEGTLAAQWVSDYLRAAARLVRMADAFVRPVDPTYAKTPAQTGFSDGYPLLLISEASLVDLNERLIGRGKASIPMRRFRPNIVVTGCDAYAEDNWSSFTIAGLSFEGVKLCARCPITTVDPATGSIPDVQEPLATLATYRKATRGVLFGQNVIHRESGTISIGDLVGNALT
ncbi:MAG: MOSC N-terminal beta barrel domain-containing protein [Chloroflexota bacterium]|nr:MOSC N-terminal beta barrel domain-containing protein [Chloroflexota bacterium]